MTRRGTSGAIYLTETDLTELTRSVLLGRSVKLGDNDRPTYRPRYQSDVPVPTEVPTEGTRYSTETATETGTGFRTVVPVLLPLIVVVYTYMYGYSDLPTYRPPGTEYVYWYVPTDRLTYRPQSPCTDRMGFDLPVHMQFYLPSGICHLLGRLKR